MEIRIIQATKNHLPDLVPLLDAYRMFYNQDSNELAAKNFLEARFKNKDSVILIAMKAKEAVGFVQLYPSFSTVSLLSIYILNDLYVAKKERNKGLGEALLTFAQQLCRDKEIKGLALETAIDNPAQKLYERLGWKKDVHCFHYFWTA